MSKSPLSKYLKKDPKTKSVHFIGDSLEVRIPLRFQNHKCLEITDEVTTLALFDFIVNEKDEDGYFLPALITMRPSNIKYVSEGSDKFVQCTFLYGDAFIVNTVIPRNSSLAYVIFYEVIVCGNRSKHIDYFKLLKIFKFIQEVCDVKFDVNQKAFELLVSHLTRLKGDITTFYRNTDMKGEPEILKQKDVAHVATTFMGRVAGSYATDATRSHLVNPAKETSPIDEIYRK